MTRLAPLLLVLLAFLAASCNGDDDAPAREAPSQQEYADRANQICRETEQSLDDVAQGAESPEDIVRAIDDVIEESRNAVRELSTLERPDGEAGERADRFVDATRTEIQGEGIPVLEELRDAIEADDEAAVRDAAQRLQNIDTSASNRAARAIGATACADEQEGD
jgi:hypothetical protein